ncbi:hypothetical protein HMPREF1620_00783 [Escherichia coli 909945-2]|nr:hypothetical protein HMPREF1620_00783 [Escherichia coli 909945-2]
MKLPLPHNSYSVLLLDAKTLISFIAKTISYLLMINSNGYYYI